MSVEAAEKPTETDRAPRWRTGVSYLALVALPAAIAVLILLHQPAGATQRAEALVHIAIAVPVYRALLGIVLIMAVAHALGAVAVKLEQPKVIGEIAAGLLLGPSVLGAVAPGAVHWLWMPATVTLLGLLGQLGVAFFMFLIGRELPFPLPRGNGARCLLCGHASIALPFLSGVVVATTMLARFRAQTVSPLAFVMFCGIALSVTAFPVLARVLADVGLRGTGIAALGLTTAAIADITGWCVLTLVVTVVQAGTTLDTVRTIGLTLAFAAVMWWLVRPLLVRLSSRAERTRT
jgi:Kef-type K+ transport system membrane component KefB